MDYDGANHAHRVNHDVPLASVYLLASIVSTYPAHFGSLNRLAVNNGRAGSWLSATRPPNVLPQVIVELLPNARSLECAEVSVDRAKGRQVMWYEPSGAS